MAIAEFGAPFVHVRIDVGDVCLPWSSVSADHVALCCFYSPLTRSWRWSRRELVAITHFYPRLIVAAGTGISFGRGTCTPITLPCRRSNWSKSSRRKAYKDGSGLLDR